MSEPKLIIHFFLDYSLKISFGHMHYMQLLSFEKKMSQRKNVAYWNLDKWCNNEIQTLMSTGPEFITENKLKKRATQKAYEKGWEIPDINYWWKTFLDKYSAWNVSGAKTSSKVLRISKLL